MDTEQLAKLNSMYPLDDSDFPYHNVSQTMTDAFFVCTARKMAKVYSSLGIPVTRCVFDHQLELLRLPTNKKIPVKHADGTRQLNLDLAFWWGFTLVMTPGGEERELANVMMDAAAKFAACPDPNNCPIGGNNGSPIWPRYNANNATHIVLRTPVEKMQIEPDNAADAKCDFYESIILSKLNRIVGINFSLPVPFPERGPMEAIFKFISQSIDMD
jgi:Carboxylesterase family